MCMPGKRAGRRAFCTDSNRIGSHRTCRPSSIRATATVYGNTRTRIARISAAAVCRSCAAAGDADIYGIGFGVQLTAAS